MEAKIVALVLVAVFGALGLDWLNVLPSLAEMLKFLQDAPAPEPTGLISAAVLQVCSLYDDKARAFRAPFTVPHVDVAIRAIRALLVQGDARNEVVAHADDHVLYHLGAFDDSTGQMNTHAPVVVARVAQLRPEFRDNLPEEK